MNESNSDDECKRTRGKQSWAISRCCSGIRLKGLRKIMKHLNSVVSVAVKKRIQYK